jgi:hypothetical protein
VITDATACIGGNTIYFEKDFKIDEKIELFIVGTPERAKEFPVTADVEISENGEIDIGEVVAQYLYLNAV